MMEKEKIKKQQTGINIPKDLSDSGNPSTYGSGNDGDAIGSLFDYFNQKDGIIVIKKWSTYFSSNALKSFCEVLSSILQIAGKRIEITTEHIESDAYDIVLEEFQEASESSDFNEPPITKLLKDKKNNNKLPIFWQQLSESMISCNALCNPTYNQFRQWLIEFSKSKIRLVRQSASMCIFAIFNALTVSLSKITNELIRVNQIDENSSSSSNEVIKSQKNLFEQEIRIYLSASFHLLQKGIIPRLFDVDENIRISAVTSMTDGILAFPNEFADFEKMKYLGKALSDKSSRNRRDVLRCIDRIFSEISNSDQLRPFAEHFSQKIIELCDEKDNAIVASALDVLYKMTEKDLLCGNDCIRAADLLSDDSQAIRAAAAKFVARQYFYRTKSGEKGDDRNEDKNGGNDEENSEIKSEIGHFVEFAARFSNDELPAAVASLFKNIKCLHKWDCMCEMLLSEEKEENSRLLAKILLFSAERTLGRLLSSPPEPENRIRKLTTALVKNLPILIKAYQTDDETVLPLVEAARLLNLDVISESSYDHFYQKLLGEIRDLFLHSSNRSIFTSAIASLYELSIGSHQLSEIARKEIDRLAVECAKIENVEMSVESIAKFVAAARLVNVSDGGKLRDVVIEQLKKSNDKEFVADCIECLHYFFKWDIKRIKDKKISKDSYRTTFLNYINIFYEHLLLKRENMEENSNSNENSNENSNATDNKNEKDAKIEEQAFKALGTVIALSGFVKRDQNDDELVSEEIIRSFFSKFHQIEKKTELFSTAKLPILTHSVDLSYSVHLFVYFGKEDLQFNVKFLWNELALRKPINGSQLYDAFRESHLEESVMKTSARFILGKVRAFDFLNQFFEKENENENENKEEITFLIPAILPFFFGISAEEAKTLQSIANIRYEEILTKVSLNEKPTQKMFSRLLPAKPKPTKEENTEKIAGNNNRNKDTVREKANVKSKKSAPKKSKVFLSSEESSSNSDHESNSSEGNEMEVE